MVTVVNAVQLRKALSPIVLIDAGRLMLVKARQDMKALAPISTRAVGKVTEVKSV